MSRKPWGKTRALGALGAIALVAGLVVVPAGPGLAAGPVTSFTGISISNPIGITPGPDGALWFTNAGLEYDSIGRITTTGVVSSFTGVGIYAAALAATGGTAPYRWKKSGAFPKGLKLDARTGLISGTPTKTGSFAFTVLVKDKSKPKRITTKSYTMSI